MLDLIRVNKSFGEHNDFEVLKDISISAKRGEFVCVIGPSGCGKTILLYLIASFLNPTNGEIFVEDKPIFKPDCNRMMIFQNYVLFPWKTVYENILFALDNVSTGKSEKHELVMKYLDLIGLIPFKDWYPYKLSGGMQQRVALARSLVTNPDVLLMDEPFAALDSQYRNFLRQNLEKIWERTKKTILFVTHSVHEAVSLADKIYLLSARPTIVKKEYKVDLRRPRDPLDSNFIKLHREIEKDLSEEFEKIIKNPAMEESLSHILKLGEKRNLL